MPKPNAYVFYMKHYQEEQRKLGNFYDLAKCSIDCADKWSKMTKEQRAPFEQKARDARGNGNGGGSRGAHRTSQRSAVNFNQTHPPPLPSGAQSDDLLQQQQEEEVRYEYRVNMVKSLINAMSNKNQLINTKLFVIASNIVVKTDKNQYLPLEIGIVQFSIKDGLTDSLHQFINPGPIPLGYARQAKEHEQLTHKIPPGHHDATDDYVHLVDTIYNFLSTSRFNNSLTNEPTPMIVFCPEFSCNDDMTCQNIGVFKWLWDKYLMRKPNPGFEFDLEVLDLILLGSKIAENTKGAVPLAIIEDRLKSVVYDYTPGLNCELHEEQENRFCAVGVAKRWAYLFLDFACPLLDMKLTQAHVPKRPGQIQVETHFPVVR